MISKQITRRLLYLLLIIVIFIGMSFYLRSDNFLAVAAKLATKFYPPLRIGQISGNLFSHIEASDVMLHDKTIDVRIKKAAFTWQPSQLFDKHLLITDATINGANIIYIDEGKKSNSQLPIDITLQNLNLQNIKFQYQTKDTNFKLPLLQIAQSQLNTALTNQSMQIAIQQFTGQINQYPLTLTGAFNKNGAQYQFQQIKIASADSELFINGQVQQQWDLTWQLNSPDLHKLDKQLFGQIASVGDIKGDLNNPAMQANLTLNNIKLVSTKTLSIQKANLTVNTEALQKGSVNANLALQAFHYNDYHITNATANVSGTQAKHVINIALANKEQHLVLQAIGGYLNQQWQGQLTQANLAFSNFAPLTLTKKTNLIISKNNIVLKSLCLNAQNQQVCAYINYQKNKLLNANILAKQVQLNNLQAFIQQPKLTYTGTIDLQSNLSIAANGVIQQQTELILNPGRINYHSDDKTQTLSYQQGTLISTNTKDGLMTKFNLQLVNQQKLQGYFNILGYRNINDSLNNKQIRAEISAYNDQLFWLTDLMPSISSPSGTIKAKVNLLGTIKKPKFQGNIQLSNGSVKIPALNLNLQKIQITGSGDLTNAINWQGVAYSGGQALRINGTTLLNQAGLPTKLNLAGKNILIANTDSYKINASPNIVMNYADQKLSFKGSVNIDKATLDLGNFTGSSVTLPDDVVFVDNIKKQTEKPLNLTANINLDLGKNVSITTRGFTGKLLGNLLLDYDPQNTTTAFGAISVENGQYSAYGRVLAINEGKLIFNGGPIDNPALNIEATRTVTVSGAPQSNASLDGDFLTPYNYAEPGKVLVGVNVTGTAKNYQVNLFSQPAVYNQSDILSLLLFGTTTDQISSASGQILLSAASQLNLGNAQSFNIVQQLQNAFGLDQLGVTQESIYDPTSKALIQTPSLSLGKQINKRFFLNYSIGITDPISVITLRYLLTKNFSVQTNASQLGSGFDVFYSVERN